MISDKKKHLKSVNIIDINIIHQSNLFDLIHKQMVLTEGDKLNIFKKGQNLPVVLCRY